MTFNLCNLCGDPCADGNTYCSYICADIVRTREKNKIVTTKLAVFCVYTNKQITGDICPDCNRFDCAVDFEDMPIQLTATN